MAIDKDLMNTQTGGEGETVQIQTQENVTPEQFDIKITPQEPTADSEQVTTTETVTEQSIPTDQPIEPPAQRKGMVEVQGAKPSEFYEAQASFNEEPPAIESEYNPFFDESNFIDIDENGKIIEKEQYTILAIIIKKGLIQVLITLKVITTPSTPHPTFYNLPTN